MLRDILLAIIKALKWFVGWPRPVVVPKFKEGQIVWYSVSRYDNEAEGDAKIGSITIIKVDREIGEINYLIKTNPRGFSAVWRKESLLQPYIETDKGADENE